jgi:type I restriction enzyme S subunit
MGIKIKWPIVRCGEFLSQNTKIETVEPDKLYRLLGVRLEGKGPFIREKKIGAEIHTKRLQRIGTGDFVYSRLFAWRGAFGLVDADMDGAYVSNEFPNFRIDEEKTYPKFLYFYFKQKWLWDEVRKYCTGTTKVSRNRFKEKFFLNFEIPLPPIDEQKRIANKIEKLLKNIDEAKILQKQTMDEAEIVIDSVLRQILTVQANAPTWEEGSIPNFAEVNPSRKGKTNYPPLMPISFVPMEAVDDVTGRIVRPIVRPFIEVSKGYTWFKDGDVIFARITPCMQNGKAALADGLTNGVGFGSTEFHVLRPGPKILGRWLHYLVRSKDFRDEAATHFKGTAGQQRVPQSFLEKKEINVPPLPEQRRIITYLDSLQEKIGQLKKIQIETKKEIEELFPSILDKAFKGEL